MKLVTLIALLMITQMATAATLCPDGSYVGGPDCYLAPDGSYVDGYPELAPDGSYVGDHNNDDDYQNHDDDDYNYDSPNRGPWSGFKNY